MITLSIIALCLVTGFAAAVWTLMAWITLRRRHWWGAFWLTLLALALVIGTVIITASLLRHPLDLPRGTTTLLLVPIIGVPAVLQFSSWLKTRDILRRGAA